jgi:hypothetical protein
VLSLLFGFVPIAIIAGVIAVISTARRYGDERDLDPGIGTVRRLFVYVLALTGLIFGAVGVSLLVTGVLEALFEDVVIAERSQQLSIALAFTLVGAPAWLVFAYIAQRSVTQHAVEVRSQARRLYFSLVRGIALAIIAANAISAGRMLLGLNPFDADPWGWLVAWSGVWLLHQRFAVAEPAPTIVTRLIERLYLYFGAILGLYLLLWGVSDLLSAPLRALYDSLASASLVNADWDRGLRAAAATAAAGGVIWGWHWVYRLAASDRPHTLWHVQVFVFGTLTGLALTVIPGAVLLYTVLEWWVGVSASTTASTHFDEVPGILAALVTGAATWGYHRALLLEGDTRGPQTEPERLYRYVVAAAGLLTAAIGVATLLAVAFDSLAGEAGALLRSAGWWRNAFVRGITLLVVGAPLWARYWFAQQRVVVRGDVDDRTSLSRRAFLFAAVGASLLAFIVGLIVVLFQFFDDTLASELSRATLRDARWALATVLSSAGIAVYYFLVLREDQRAEPEAAPAATVRAREVLLVAPSAPALVTALEQLPGIRVRSLRRLDADGAGLSAAQLETLRDAVRDASADRVVVIVGRSGYEVVPYVEA